MPAALLSILGPLIPYILLIIGVIGAYLGIKQKGAQQERSKQQAAQAKAVQQVQKKVQVAVAKDTEIDKQTSEKKNEIEQTTPEPEQPTGPLTPGSDFKF